MRNGIWAMNNSNPFMNINSYLGNVLSTKLSSNEMQTEIASRARAALLVLLRSLRKLNHVPPNVFFKLFDAQIQPMLLYGSEIWGLEDCHILEQVHLCALKRFLNVSPRSPNDMVYGETGRFPLCINARLRCIKYWLKILKMEESRLPKRVYVMMLNSVEHKWLWTSKVRRLLVDCDLEHVWAAQHVNDEATFLKDVRNKLTYVFYEEWERRIMVSNRYDFYRQFKCCWGVEQYLYDIDKKVFRDVFVRFRMGISDLYVHKFRYTTFDVQKLCPLCREELETEKHFLLCCPALCDLRERYLYVNGTCENLTSLLSNRQMKTIRSISMYLYKAFSRRQQAVESFESDSFFMD